METVELLKKVRKIEIKTLGMSNQIFSGGYHSAFKGRGMAFSEVREYQPGDDIRTIDWNVTARFNSPYVKVFEEEREMTVMLLADVSASGVFGTQKQVRQDLITELCAVLAFSAIQNNDKIGIIFFSDKIEKYIPPKKGRSHILHIIRDLIEFKPEHKQTNIEQALRYFSNVVRKKSIAFLLSDFIDPRISGTARNGFSDALKIAKRRHDLIALQISDPREHTLPDIGLVKLMDAESGALRWVDTSDKKTRTAYAASALQRDAELKTVFHKCGVGFAKISTHESYIQPLMNLFGNRV
ncbi:MAG TPA: DUF58 domain-containing protein [Bacteroidia bacterium]|jgi:uncharacterized protein (DUF58 family)|nr:DUF58 domain-containing protein [Bacteroidia bacterium]